MLHPEGIKHVLSTGQGKYSKMVRGTQLLALIGGRGLLTSEGEFWQQSRRVIQPFFIKKQYARYVELMNDCALNLVARWKEKFLDSQFDLSPEMTKFTLNVLGRSIFNVDFDAHTDTVYEALRGLLNITEDRIVHIIPRRGRAKREQDQAFAREMKILEDLVDALIVKSKQAESLDPDKNFIHAMMASEVKFTDIDLRDHVISLLIAGHETTATALSWLFILLEQHPEQKNKILQEIKAVSGERVSLEALESLQYTKCCAQEALRLYPPFWIMGRVATQDDELLGHPIKKGDRIQINPYFTHHNPRY
jgi:cytochrome P450